MVSYLLIVVRGGGVTSSSSATLRFDGGSSSCATLRCGRSTIITTTSSILWDGQGEWRVVLQHIYDPGVAVGAGDHDRGPAVDGLELRIRARA